MRRATGQRALAALLCAGALAGCSQKPELVVFHAASLSRVLSEIAEQFQRENPEVRVRLEPSGSQVAVRKITELGMRADVLLVADLSLLDPGRGGPPSSLTAAFATNEIVLAHMDHSRFTEEVTSANWPEILLRDGVRLGCSDPQLAPIGYHTELAWQLASPELAAKLRARCAGRTAPDETELVALLESRAADYAFLYRTTAEDHHLKIVALPPEQNLSRAELAPRYAQASVTLAGRTGPPRQVRGAPIVYGLALPAYASHPELAARFADFLRGEGGRRALQRAGFGLLAPAGGAP